MVDRRRGRKRASEAGDSLTTATAAPSAAGTGDLTAVLAKLDAVLAEQHELRRLVHRMTVPVEVVSLAEAARRLSCSTKSVKRLHAGRLFTDGRPPEKRVAGADLVFYADEIDAYRADGERGVKRLREQLGRN